MTYYEERLLRKNGLLPPISFKKKKKFIPKFSKKKAEKIAKEKASGSDETQLVEWYKSRIKEMRGSCLESMRKTNTVVYKYAICSICHILPKSLCPSVATHPLNWIELHPDVHSKFDNMGWDSKRKMNIWATIFERLKILAPLLSDNEIKYLPDELK